MVGSVGTKWLLFGGVVAWVFVCFAPDLGNALLAWDDAGYIVENTRIHSLSASTVTWAFTEFHCNYWAPLTWLSLALDHALWGLDPVGYHLTNNALHAVTSGLVFLVACRLLLGPANEDSRRGGVPPRVVLGFAAAAAVLFGVHPLRVESVAWAAERKDVLSMAFGMGAVLAYLRYVDGEGADGLGSVSFFRAPAYWLMLGLYSLSLMSKGMLVTLPVVFLLLDWHPLGRLRREGLTRVAVEKLPMFLMAWVVTVITAQAMAVTSKSLAEVGLPARALVAFWAIVEYLHLTVLPIGITPVSFHPGNVSMDLGYGLAIAVVLVLTAGAVLARPRWPSLLVGWGAFLITIFPVLGFLQNGPQAMAARFSYFPSVALWVLVAAAGVSLWSGLASNRALRAAIPAAALALLAVFSTLTVRDIGTWRSDVTLWNRVIDLQPHRFGKAYFYRSLALSREGRHREALVDAETALGIAARKQFPGIHENHAQVASVLRDLGDLAGAIDSLDKAIEASVPPWSDHYRMERASIREALDLGETAGPVPRSYGAGHGGT